MRRLPGVVQQRRHRFARVGWFEVEVQRSSGRGDGGVRGRVADRVAAAEVV